MGGCGAGGCGDAVSGILHRRLVARVRRVRAGLRVRGGVRSAVLRDRDRGGLRRVLRGPFWYRRVVRLEERRERCAARRGFERQLRRRHRQDFLEPRFLQRQLGRGVRPSLGAWRRRQRNVLGERASGLFGSGRGLPGDERQRRCLPGALAGAAGPRALGLHGGQQRVARQRVLERSGKRQRQRIAVLGARAQCAREHLGERRDVGRLDAGGVHDHAVARQRRPAAGDEFERHAGQGEDVRCGAHRIAARELRRRVRAARRRAVTHTLERGDHAEAREAHLVGRHEDVARVERAVVHAGRGREIERAGQLADQPHRVRHGRRTVLLQRDVGRLRDEVLLDEIGGRARRRRRQAAR